MKKNSGGYVLVYVLIVIVLLSLLALGVCSIALRNLQTQQASVEQMQERYEVEGNMERFVAKLQELQVEDSTRYSDEGTAHSAARTRFWTEVQGTANGIVTLQGDEPAWEVDDSCKLTVHAVLGDQVLTAVLDVSVSISITTHWISTPTEDDPNNGHNEYSYSISSTTYKYDSYDISAVSAAGDEGGEAA